MASIGAIAASMGVVQDKMTNDMKAKAEALAGKPASEIDQKDLNQLQVATELVKSTNQVTQGAITAVGEGMTTAARAANR
jgi:hypothetical protein